MAQHASLRDFNHQVAKYVYQVEQGENLIITRYGKPVAELVPYRDKITVLEASKKTALNRSLRLLNKAKPVKGFRFNRDEIYDR